MEYHVTQRLSISVQNDLPKGDIVIKNTLAIWYLKDRYDRSSLELD